MTSVVSLRAFANSANVPLVDLQQEYLAIEEMSADEAHRAVCTLSGVYVEVYETAEWIAATMPRKLGNGRGVGG